MSAGELSRAGRDLVETHFIPAERPWGWEESRTWKSGAYQPPWHGSAITGTPEMQIWVKYNITWIPAEMESTVSIDGLKPEIPLVYPGAGKLKIAVSDLSCLSQEDGKIYE